MGTFALEYSISLYKASAQKWGGVHINIIKNNIIGKKLKLSETDTQPISGGNAPAAPPITIFWGVFFFNHTVYTKK